MLPGEDKEISIRTTNMLKRHALDCSESYAQGFEKGFDNGRLLTLLSMAKEERISALEGAR